MFSDSPPHPTRAVKKSAESNAASDFMEVPSRRIERLLLRRCNARAEGNVRLFHDESSGFDGPTDSLSRRSRAGRGAAVRPSFGPFYGASTTWQCAHVGESF